MNDEPVKVFAFVLSNMVVTIGSLVMAFGVLPRLRVKFSATVGAGITFFAVNALQHAYVTYGLLFADYPVGTSTTLLLLRVATAAALAAFTIGILANVASWKKLQVTMRDKGARNGND